MQEYIEKHPKWKKELEQLRDILINFSALTETIKWGMPVYTVKGKNVVGMAAFKNHYALWFYHGVYLNDTHKLLVNAQEGKTKALRQLKFTATNQPDFVLLKKYIAEAIQLQKKGKVMPQTRAKKLVLPDELSTAFNQDLSLQNAFKELTPGRQREYAQYISEAKRETTKQKRLQKIIPMIKQKVGLHDKYRK